MDSVLNQFLYRISESSGFTNNGTKWNNKFGVEFKHEKSRNSLIFQGTSAFTKHMRRPERSEDRTRSGGPWFCADRSGAKTAQGPGNLGFAPTGAERRPHKIRGILVLRRPERSEDRTRSGGPWFCADRSGAEIRTRVRIIRARF